MSDIEIARAATAQPIGEIAKKIGIPDDALMPYGRTKAKIDPEYIDTRLSRFDDKILDNIIGIIGVTDRIGTPK